MSPVVIIDDVMLVAFINPPTFSPVDFDVSPLNTWKEPDPACTVAAKLEE